MANCISYVCVLLSVCALSNAYVLYKTDHESLKQLWKQWLQEYNPFYKTVEHYDNGYQAFQENVEYINKLNMMHNPYNTLDNSSMEFKLNKFADLTVKQFQQKILMPEKRKTPKFEQSRYISTFDARDLPESFDWTAKGAVTPVKDQGDVGTCWAFSTIENIEGQWQRLGKPLTNLSVEQVVECDGNYDHGGKVDSNADCGIFGGWPYLAYQYIMKAGGLETWEDYWYCSGLGGAPGTCSVCPAAGYNWTLCGPPVPYCNMSQSCAVKINPKKFVPGLKVADWKAIDTNESIIAEQLMSIGPLSVALDATLLQFYHKGVFNPLFCSKTNLDHAVLIVGFGTEKDLFSSKPFWKVKNSWGPKWGESGYFRMERGSGTCGVNTQVTTAVLQNV